MFRQVFKIKAVLVLALTGCLFLSAPVLAADNTLSEVKTLLQNQYVDPVSSEVLAEPSIDATLQKLGDPHTVYFSADEYQDFLNSMDMTFSGIGVYINIVPEGLAITSVIEGSPAVGVGLQSGDIITEAAGQSLAGMPQETAVGLLRGPEGSSVAITVLRGKSTLHLEVTRHAIEVPTVDGQLVQGRIGLIAIHTFGATTPASFEKTVQSLKGKGAKAWIIDLRDNPGGYLTSALDLAGYFIGDQTALQTKDRSGTATYPGVKHAFSLSEPTIFLTNENSASASEILTSDVKDYGKATIVGNRTYGKGSVQTMYPLTDGSVLKMTVAKFYSPYGNEINKVGINPDIKIVKADAEKVAELLLKGVVNPESLVRETSSGAVSSSGKDGLVLVSAHQQPWTIALEQARTPDFWKAYGELLSTVSAADVQKGEGQGWVNLSDAEKAKGWPLYYPDYREIPGLKDVPLNKKFTVTFGGPIQWSTVTQGSLELIERESGQRVPLEFKPLNDRQVQVIPTDPLEAGKTYWLLTHRTIKSEDGTALRDGALAVIQTVPTASTPSIQSSRPLQTRQPQGELWSPAAADYGQALLDWPGSLQLKEGPRK